MDLLLQVADLNHLSKVFTHYQQKSRRRSGRARLRPGSDGQTLAQFAERLDVNLRHIRDSLISSSYVFSPLVERKITLAGGTTRTVSTATVRDTIVQKAIALIVEPQLDSCLEDSCYSFRLAKDAPTINEAISLVVKHHNAGRHWVVKEDISSYFENLEHEHLLSQLEGALPDDEDVFALYRSYVKAPRLVGGQVLARERGVPVGTVLANCLSNLYLTPLDQQMKEEGYQYLRYCDDILVFAESQSQALRVREAISDQVGTVGLSLNDRKSQLLPPRGRFVFLGYEFDGQQIRIGPRAMQKFKARMRGATHRKAPHRAVRQALRTAEGRAILRQVIAQVNREIAGDTPRNWARYFARCDFDDQFRELDFWIRNRVRAAVTKRWNKADYRLVPTPVLQELGLKSLVNEYYKWKNRWRRREQGLMPAIARLDHLREILEAYRQRYYDTRSATYTYRPGTDGITMQQFLTQETSNLRAIQENLLDGNYGFAPFFEYAKAKRGRTDERVVCRASLADTIVQKAMATVVDRRLDHLLSEQCYSYRRGRSQFGAVGRVLALVNSQQDWWVVRSDFRAFLDHVDLTTLSAQLEDLLADEPSVLDLYLKYLYNGRRRDGKLLPRTCGLPRGGILTPFLANLYLTPLDEAMTQGGFHYTRYADDIVVFAETEDLARQSLERIGHLAGELGLAHSPEKSTIIPPGQAFEFLGYAIKGNDVSIRPFAINSLKRRIRRVTAKRKYPQLDVQHLRTDDGKAELRSLIGRVNRTYIYKGGSDWTRHFCRCSSDQQFRELDAWIADRLRAAVTKRWAVKNRRLIPYRLLRELGWRPLVPLYWRWRKEVWRQGASSS
jgi:group II intron reverse transcriptase/maturase